MSVNSSHVPVLQHIFFPSDFSPASEPAFAHALKAALVAKADLTILHVSTKQASDWTDFPGVRAVLERWGLLPKGSTQADVLKLGIGVKKIKALHEDPVEAVVAYLDTHATDLIVVATDRHKDKAQWLSKSVAAPIARKSGQMTLFLLKGVDGFVSMKDGSISLKSILVPVASTPSPQPAIHAAVRIAHQLNCSSGFFTLIHVGKKDSMPDVQLPDLPGWTWNRVVREGEVVDVIHETALEVKASLIVLTTEGRHGFLDALRGSHSERLLQRSPCPLLVIPASGFISSVL